MGKTYIDTVKYLVYANVEIVGLVEKPDVVGAIFGQTEGLLGDDMDLRDLQKNGRIGRIEVDLNPRGGRSIGKIKLPSSLDMVETCILAAALETVDRVGPCEARIGVEKIEDTRNSKRKVLVDRAKNLLKSLLTTEIPESKEISEMVRAEVKISEIAEFGPEKLPCGPGIDKLDAIIIVEGRADVINLLKNDINNVIGVGGATVPASIVKLCREKEVTLFLDGDRGGDIILAQLANAAEIEFVARAPSGKEVEELTRKELIKCLRSKVPYEQSNGIGRQEKKYEEEKPAYRQEERHAPSFSGREERRYESRSRDRGRGRYDDRRRDEGERLPTVPLPPMSAAPALTPFGEQSPAVAPSAVAPVQAAPVAHVEAAPARAAAPAEVPPELLASLGELENTLKARIYGKDMGMLREVAVRDMIRSLGEENSVGAIVFDGIITQRLADLAEQKGASVLVGVRMGNVFRKPTGTLVYTKA
ncbi:DNA primase DnaG [Candidatus Anstonella stagnisolia]|nr:DNA primase DnaG [Candidatus Anstonella stagnisolia]